MVVAAVLVGMTLAACGEGDRRDETPELTEAPTATSTVSPTQTPSEAPADAEQPARTPTATTFPYWEITPVFEAGAQPVGADEILFPRPGYGMDSFPLGIPTVELWAIGRDGSNERLITTYNPATWAPLWPEASPDGRYAAFSDTPGLVVLDREAGQKIVIGETGRRDQWVRRFAWTPDSRALYYAVDGEDIADHTIYRQTVPPEDEPVLMVEAPTVEVVDGERTFTMPEYPHMALPDGRLLLIASDFENFNSDTSIFDPAGPYRLSIRSEFDRVVVWDVAADGTLLFYSQVSADELGSCVPCTGRIDPYGRLVEIQQVTRPNTVYEPRFLPDGSILAHEFNEADRTHNLVLLSPGGPGEVYQKEILISVGAPYLEQQVVAMIDDWTALLYRWDEVEGTLWRYPLHGQPVLLVRQFGPGG